MSVPPDWISRWLLWSSSDPDVSRAVVDGKRRELMYRGVGATITMWAGGLMVAAIAITWILKLSGVL